MIQLQACTVNSGLPPVCIVWNYRVTKGQRSPHFKARFRAHPRFIPSAETVGTQILGSEQRQKHNSVIHEITGQATIEQGHTVLISRVIDPVLGRELNANRTSDRAEGDFLKLPAVSNRRGKKRLVPN